MTRRLGAALPPASVTHIFPVTSMTWGLHVPGHSRVSTAGSPAPDVQGHCPHHPHGASCPQLFHVARCLRGRRCHAALAFSRAELPDESLPHWRHIAGAVWHCCKGSVRKFWKLYLKRSFVIHLQVLMLSGYAAMCPITRTQRFHVTGQTALINPFIWTNNKNYRLVALES